MSDRLNGISVFVTAVEAGNFALAASRLHLSRSAVGKTIARLEQRLGVRLFHRTTRSQSLTDDGALFYERCLRALEEIRTAETLLESGKRQVSGRLRVSMPVLFGRLCIAPILTELAREHPQLELELSFNDRLVDMIEDGFDLVVRNGALPDSARLVARRLGNHHMAFCASPAYLARCGEPTTLDALAQHDAVAYLRSGTIRNWEVPLEQGETRLIAPRARLVMDDLQALADATMAGFGIGWLPCWLVRDQLLSGELVRVLQQYPGAEFNAHALWPHTPHLPLKVRLAVDALANKLPASMALIEAQL
ncbi:LysR family transcriptional regulator [Serratia odorifera]|jgi:DNA-binding transcriptional LysR family regulator|uniref:LysR substrate binding domain protein n=2 Tax=Serratia odorifera TaxID=618 RepID=D4E0U2_SEROD|nr:LysR family transcriptional regulator [Serratia odorifera]EFE96545.1 LysR substrate binding domain protein [Serratia odorifera DSM 4582]MBJ2066784.1 LysR family transcriptional regulator [Serratia odorifera]PNK90971.1 LysR family transcriptional regulator [Serratia odorifera]RII72208.1 LysR family transcriptional regulator [Serratia odorifera]VDZ57407.1 D-malate degradation protein R [Serratia odorifera]